MGVGETIDSLTDQDWRILRSTHNRGDAQIRAAVQQFNDFKDVYDDMNFTSPRHSFRPSKPKR